MNYLEKIIKLVKSGKIKTKYSHFNLIYRRQKNFIFSVDCSGLVEFWLSKKHPEALQEVYHDYQTQYPDEADFLAHKAELTQDLNDKYRETNIQAGWIKNIWQPDSPMSNPVMSVEEYNKKQIESDQLKTDAQKKEYETIYNYIETEKQTNGYFLLAIIAAVTVFLSMKVNALITKRNAPKKPAEKQAEPIITYSLRDAKQQGAAAEKPMVDPAQMSKIMMWTMPLVYVFFATMQTSAFAIYMIASSVVSTLFTVGFAFLIDFILRHTKQPEIKKDFDATVINPHAKYFKGGRK